MTELASNRSAVDPWDVRTLHVFMHAGRKDKCMIGGIKKNITCIYNIRLNL